MSPLLLTLAFLAHSPVAAPAWGPWSVSDDSPVIGDTTTSGAPEARESSYPSLTVPFLWTIRFFQKFVSRADGPRCSMYPTCSQYGYEAIRAHGPLLGFFMTADRLMRDNISAEGFYPVISVYGVLRFYDPVEDNDFWWSHRR